MSGIITLAVLAILCVFCVRWITGRLRIPTPAGTPSPSSSSWSFSPCGADTCADTVFLRIRERSTGWSLTGDRAFPRGGEETDMAQGTGVRTGTRPTPYLNRLMDFAEPTREDVCLDIVYGQGPVGTAMSSRVRHAPRSTPHPLPYRRMPPTTAGTPRWCSPAAPGPRPRRAAWPSTPTRPPCGRTPPRAALPGRLLHPGHFEVLAARGCRTRLGRSARCCACAARRAGGDRRPGPAEPGQLRP